MVSVKNPSSENLISPKQGCRYRSWTAIVPAPPAVVLLPAFLLDFAIVALLAMSVSGAANRRGMTLRSVHEGVRSPEFDTKRKVSCCIVREAVELRGCGVASSVSWCCKDPGVARLPVSQGSRDEVLRSEIAPCRLLSCKL